MLPRAFISTPLEIEQVERIKSALSGRIDLVYEPDLLPIARFPADHRGHDQPRTAEQQARWQKHLEQAEFLWDIPPLATLPSADMSWAQNLRWVQCTSSGVGQLVKRLRINETSIIVTTARGVHAEPLAEFALMAILHHIRQYGRLRSDQAAHRWERYCGEGLRGKTVVVIGAGEVGDRVAKVCGFMGMRVAAMSRSLTPELGRERGYDLVFSRSELHDVLAGADALVLCVPHTSETENMIDGAALAAIKPGGVLVNIARGQVVDESALVDTLVSGHLGFAALDVAAVEPLPEDSPLWDMPNVLISPHSASTITPENGLIADLFIYNARSILDGRPDALRNRFNTADV